MKPVVANPSASFGQLLDGLEVLEDEKQIEYQIDQIIAKLQRKKRKLDSKTMEHFVSMTGGVDPSQFIQQLEQESTQQARNRILAHRDLFELLGKPGLMVDARWSSPMRRMSWSAILVAMVPAAARKTIWTPSPTMSRPT